MNNSDIVDITSDGDGDNTRIKDIISVDVNSSESCSNIVSPISPKEIQGFIPSPVSSSSSSSSSSLPPAVELRNVHKTYLLGIEGVAALRGVSLKIQRGEFIVILGKSGGGKTTLLNVLGTIDQPTRGELDLCGIRIDSKTSDSVLADIRLKKIAFVFQAFNLLPGLTALENVELPMLLSASPALPSARQFKAAQLLSRVGMAERLDHTPSQMSGGEQQRVTIARALANHPEILLLDEPTGDLDQHNSKIVIKLLTDLNKKKGVTCVMVTHDIALKSYAHRVVHMLDGRISRVEEIPSFVREEALDALADSPSVRAWENIKKAQRDESADIRRRHIGETNATESSGEQVGQVEIEEDENDDIFTHTLLAKRQAALSLADSKTLFGRAKIAAIAAFKHYSSNALTAFFKAFPQFQSRRHYMSEKLDEAPVGKEASSTNASSQSVVVKVSNNEDKTGIIQQALPESSLSLQQTSSTTLHSTSKDTVTATSSGLSGVAAISHAMFSHQISENASNDSQITSSSSSSFSSDIPIIHRLPIHYPAYAFGISQEKIAIAEEEARKEQLIKREAALRKRVDLAKAARLVARNGQ
jgi:putative ABC transport system ATP-binding protein